MKTRFGVLLFIVAVIGFFLGGCGCFIQAQKGESPPPASPEKVIAPAPEAKAVKKAIALEDIHFDFNKVTLTPEAKKILKKNIQTLKENPKVRVRIAGYTSASGTDFYNNKLSVKRANAVKKYLIKEGGIAQDRLSVTGYGKKNPVKIETTPKKLNSAEAKANMRAVFEVIE